MRLAKWNVGLFRFYVIVSVLFLLSAGAKAVSNAQGYIVTLNSDTIYGYIQLTRFDQVTGGLVLNGIEEDSFHSRVVFVPVGESHFKVYFPEMLLGFGFVHQSQNYIYQRVTDSRKSIFKSERQQYRFMRLVCKNADVVIYKDVRMMSNPDLQSNRDKWLKFNTHLFRVKPDKSAKVAKGDSIKGL